MEPGVCHPTQAGRLAGGVYSSVKRREKGVCDYCRPGPAFHFPSSREKDASASSAEPFLNKAARPNVTHSLMIFKTSHYNTSHPETNTLADANQKYVQAWEKTTVRGRHK